MGRGRPSIRSGLLYAADGVMQRLVRPRDRQIAWASDPDYIGNAFHLYRHALTTRSGLDHVWLVTDPDNRRRIESDVDAFSDSMAPGNTVRVVNRHSARGYWRRLRSRRIFHTHGLYPMASAPGRDVVSLWHGMPIKCIGALNTISPNPHPTFGTMHVATSRMFRYVIGAAFRADPDDVLVTGLPRCDVLAERHPLAPEPAHIRETLGVPAGDRLVMWLPTYRTPGHLRDAKPGIAGFYTFLDDLTDAQWRQVDDLASRTGCTVLIKLHPHDPLNDVGFDPGLEHVRLVRSAEWLGTGIELYDLLAVSDALISDVSSVLIDFLTTSRPIGIIGFDADEYTRDVVFPVSALLRSARIHDLSEDGALVDFFDRIGDDPAPRPRDDLSPWLSDVEPGTGCETVLRAVGL